MLSTCLRPVSAHTGAVEVNSLVLLWFEHSTGWLDDFISFALRAVWTIWNSSWCSVLYLFIGKIPFIHVGNQVVSELGPIVQFTKAKVSSACTDTEVLIEWNTVCLFSERFYWGISWCLDVFWFKGHSLSDGLDDVQRAEMKAYMELVNNMLLTAEVHRQNMLAWTHFLNQYKSDCRYIWVTLSHLSLLSSLQLYIQWCDKATAAEVRVCACV